MRHILSSMFFVFLLSMVFNQETFAAEENLTSGLPVQGEIESSNTKDVYQFTTDQDGEAYITLDNTTGGYVIELYDINGNRLDYEYASRSGSKVYLNKKLPKGTYYIKITPYNWSGITSATYRLKATYAAPITRDAKTFEPNDTNETSMPIISGQIYSSDSFSSIDRDIYQFTTNQDGEAYITLDNTTGGYVIELYDINGKIDWIMNMLHVLEVKVYLNKKLPKGTYYIKITPYNWSGITSATYKLKVIYAAPITRDAKTFEPNDTNETSMPIISGQIYSSDSFSSIDRDIYQFTTNQDGEAYITLDNTTGGYVIELYDINGNRLDYEYASRSGRESHISKQLKKGTYYIQITPYNWNGITSAKYRLRLNFKDKTPTVNTVADNSTVITGKAESKATVYATVGSKQIGKATAINGAYTIKIAKQKAGTSISVYTIDAAQNKSGSKTVVVIDKTPPTAPTVNKITSKSVKVTGKGEKGATIYLYNGSKKIGQGTVDSQGNFKVEIKVQNKGAALKVYALDKSGNKSTITTIKVS